MRVAWVFLPVLGAWVTHTPVLRYDLVPSWRRPIDRGLRWRGRRLLGDNKTWRGALAMWSGVALAAALLSFYPAYWNRLPEEIQRSGGLVFGALLGLGIVLAELPNSFLKRQLDIAPGTQSRSLAGAMISVIDQGDFVLGAWLTLTPIWVMSVAEALQMFVVVSVVHLAVSVAGYALGTRRTIL